MKIVNQSDIDATWRCYEEWDLLAEKTVSANGGKFSYDPPNASGQYNVNFWIGGDPTAHNPKAVNVPAGEIVVLGGSKGKYQVYVGSYPATSEGYQVG